MPNSTSRLALTEPVGTDSPSELRISITNNAGILDNAVVVTEGILAARPAAGSVEHSRLYHATDVDLWSISDGTTWFTVPMLGKAPLTAVDMTSSGTAVAGQLVIASAGVTVTLPSPGATNSLVGIVAASGVTGSSPVTVSGTNIYGVGLNNATSFVLGASGASALLMSDGTNWWIVGGQIASQILIAMTSNGTARPGQMVEADAGVTVTLPSPSLNATVGVVADASVSSSSPVTVSGTHIYGVGLSNASSFPLGVPGAFAQLISDGTNWWVVGGQQDSGWVVLSAGSGISYGTPAPYARLQGDTVRLRGELVNNTGGSLSLGYHWAGLPETAMYPSYNIYGIGMDISSGDACTVWVAPSTGIVSIGAFGRGTIPNNDSVNIDSISYPLG